MDESHLFLNEKVNAMKPSIILEISFFQKLQFLHGLCNELTCCCFETGFLCIPDCPKLALEDRLAWGRRGEELKSFGRSTQKISQVDSRKSSLSSGIKETQMETALGFHPLQLECWKTLARKDGAGRTSVTAHGINLCSHRGNQSGGS